MKWKNIPVLSPAGFVLRGLLLLVIHLACHAAGLRPYVGFLSLMPPAGTSLHVAAMLGTLYLLTWFLSVAVAAPLVVGGGTWFLAGRLIRRAGFPPAEPEPDRTAGTSSSTSRAT